MHLTKHDDGDNGDNGDGGDDGDLLPEGEASGGHRLVVQHKGFPGCCGHDDGGDGGGGDNYSCSPGIPNTGDRHGIGALWLGHHRLQNGNHRRGNRHHHDYDLAMKQSVPPPPARGQNQEEELREKQKNTKSSFSENSSILMSPMVISVL